MLINTAFRTPYLAFHYIICGLLYEWSVGFEDRCVKVKLKEFVKKLNTRFRLKETALGSRT